jgi:hypothetical protein
MGGSYGGIQTLLGAEADVRYTAAVDCSGAAESWRGNPPLQVRLKQVVANITILVFLLQAQNDFDLSPTQILGPLFQQLNRPAMVQIYSPFGTGTVGQEGHNRCFTGADVWSTHRRVPVELIFAADRLRCGAMWCERATFRERARALARRQVLGTS